MTDEHCDVCEYFRVTGGGRPPGYGRCHFGPPLGNPGSYPVGAVWPLVGRDDWCGQFAAHQAIAPALATGLVAFWRLGTDGSDSHTGGKDLSNVNPGAPASFNGDAAVLRLSPAQGLTVTDPVFDSGGSFTAAVWVRLDAGADPQYTAVASVGARQWAAMILGSDATPPPYLWALGYHSNGTQAENQRPTTSLAGWLLYMLRWDAASLGLAVSRDGAAFQTTTLPAVLDTGDPRFMLGRWIGGYGLSGELKRGAYWNRALTDANAAAYFNKGKGLDYRDIVQWTPAAQEVQP